MGKISNEEEELAKLEEELARLEKGSYGSPEQEKKEGVYKFFKEILTTKDTIRIGNLKDSELGLTKLAVRHYLDVSNYILFEDLPIVADYLKAKAGIITSTSMSRKGFWPQLFVTQIKKEHKVTPKETKTGWFGKKQPEEVGE